MLTFVPDSLSREWYAAPIMGALIVVIDGLLWGKKNWDVHPVIPACALGIVSAITKVAFAFGVIRQSKDKHFR